MGNTRRAPGLHLLAELFVPLLKGVGAGDDGVSFVGHPRLNPTPGSTSDNPLKALRECSTVNAMAEVKDAVVRVSSTST